MAPKGALFNIDNVLEGGVLAILFSYILFFGSVFEESYSKEMVDLYVQPWWRILIVCLVAVASWWSPRVGLTMALAVFLYLNDMDILTSPFLNKE
jgi:hypothetical protein